MFGSLKRRYARWEKLPIVSDDNNRMKYFLIYLQIFAVITLYFINISSGQNMGLHHQ